MNITILTPDIPYPLHMGGNVAQYAFADYLRDKISITYIFEIYNHEDESSVNTLRKLWSNVTIINSYHPEFFRSKPLTTIQRVFRKISVISNRLSKGAADAAVGVSNGSNQIFDNALWYIKPFSESYIQTVSEHLQERKPDLIQVEHSKGLCLGDLDTGNIPKLFIHHEVQFGMLESLGMYDKKNTYSQYIIDITKNIESTLLQSFQKVLTFSESDKQKLQASGVEDVEAIPFPILPTDLKEPRLELQVDKLLFVGGDWHYPNLDAISWYAAELGAQIYAAFGLKLHIVGRWREENIKKFACEFLVFEGFVDDVYAFGRNAINIAPIRIGAGVRTKLLSAMASSQPIITTTVGADGLDVSTGNQVLMADNLDQFLKAIEQIKSNPKYAVQMCNNALTYLNTAFNQQILSEKRLAVYEKMVHAGGISVPARVRDLR